MKTNSQFRLNKIEKLFFPPHFLFLGIMLFIGGIYLIANHGNYLGILLCLAGLIFAVSLQGVKLEPEKKRLKPFFQFLFIKIHSVQPLDDFRKIGIFSQNRTTGMTTRGIEVTRISEKICSLEFLNENHSKRIYFREFKNAGEAAKYARFLEEEYGFKLVRYNPPEARRRRAREAKTGRR